MYTRNSVRKCSLFEGKVLVYGRAMTRGKHLNPATPRSYLYGHVCAQDQALGCGLGECLNNSLYTQRCPEALANKSLNPLKTWNLLDHCIVPWSRSITHFLAPMTVNLILNTLWHEGPEMNRRLVPILGKLHLGLFVHLRVLLSLG